MEAMKDMADNQYDLAIVDPPYGIGLSFSVMAAYYLRLGYIVPFWGEGEFLQPIYVFLISVTISTPIFLFFGLYLIALKIPKILGLKMDYLQVFLLTL